MKRILNERFDTKGPVKSLKLQLKHFSSHICLVMRDCSVQILFSINIHFKFQDYFCS